MPRPPAVGSGMMVAHASRGTVNHADTARLLREAQYPARAVAFDDPDGSPILVTY